jgi:hypothetical protein
MLAEVPAVPVVKESLIMTNFTELNCEETKLVIGGAAKAVAVPVMRKGNPIEVFIHEFIVALERAFGGGREMKRAL